MWLGPADNHRCKQRPTFEFFLARRKPCGSALRSKRSRSHANENHHWKRLTDFAIAVDNRPNAPGGSGKRQSFQLRQTQTFRPPVRLSHSYSPNCNGHKVKKKRQAVCWPECLTLAHFSCIDSGRLLKSFNFHGLCACRATYSRRIHLEWAALFIVLNGRHNKRNAQKGDVQVEQNRPIGCGGCHCRKCGATRNQRQKAETLVAH